MPSPSLDGPMTTRSHTLPAQWSAWSPQALWIIGNTQDTAAQPQLGPESRAGKRSNTVSHPLSSCPLRSPLPLPMPPQHPASGDGGIAHLLQRFGKPGPDPYPLMSRGKPRFTIIAATKPLWQQAPESACILAGIKKIYLTNTRIMHESRFLQKSRASACGSGSQCCGKHELQWLAQRCYALRGARSVKCVSWLLPVQARPPNTQLHILCNRTALKREGSWWTIEVIWILTCVAVVFGHLF